MTEAAGLFRRKDRTQLLFHAQRIGAAVGKSETSRDADTVRIADVSRLVVDVAQDEIRRFAPDPGEGQKLLHRVGDFAAVLFQKELCALDQM